ncbi:hypothetical protein [Algivirga pacifica]|uniref:ABC transporter ATPase n=1 Tax=Algivirga pacifica TaxID=1162670 RepID=A0ABP9D8H4_9BACT
MYIAFENIPNHSRIWVYQSSRVFSSDEQKGIAQLLENFINQWDTHGTALKGSFEIIKDRFIILAVDQEHHAPSGCSIDKSVAIIKAIEEQLNVQLFSRTEVAVETNNGLEIIPMMGLKKAVEDGLISSETPVYDNTIQNVAQYREEWPKALNNTWLKRYLPKAVQ